MTCLQFVAAIVCAALVLWGSDARAATSEPRIALVVGNAAYRNAAPLKNPVNDARDMARALGELGFEVITVENGNRQQLEHAIGEFSAKLTEGSVGLFYYSGHGIQENGRNFLIPVDANLATEAAVRLEAVEVDLVLELMNLAQTRVNLVILDACRSNPFERRFRAIGRGLAPVEQAPRGTLVAYSTAPGKVASDGDGPNGLYTAELLKAIRMPGLKVEEVFKSVRIAVSKASHDYQTPWESSSLTGDFFFKPLPSDLVVSRPISPDEAIWEVIKGGSDQDFIVVFLKNYPNSEFAPLAQKKLASLTGRSEQGTSQGATASGPVSSTSQAMANGSLPTAPTIGTPSYGPLEAKPPQSKADSSPISVALVPPPPGLPTPSPQQITEAQTHLASLGYFAGKPDGKAGAKTVSALKEFQGDQHLKVDGEINQELLAKLEAVATARAEDSKRASGTKAQKAKELIDAGIDAYDRREIDEAISKIRAGTTIHDDARAEFYLGEAYRSKNDASFARLAYARAMYLSPDSTEGTAAANWVKWIDLHGTPNADAFRTGTPSMSLPPQSGQAVAKLPVTDVATALIGVWHFDGQYTASGSACAADLYIKDVGYGTLQGAISWLDHGSDCRHGSRQLGSGNTTWKDGHLSITVSRNHYELDLRDQVLKGEFYIVDSSGSAKPYYAEFKKKD